MDKLLGAQVRLQRRFAGLTQEALAERVDITYQQLQKYELGANRISATRLLLIAEALNVPIGQFFPGSEVADWMGDPKHLCIRRVLERAQGTRFVDQLDRLPPWAFSLVAGLVEELSSKVGLPASPDRRSSTGGAGEA